VGCLGSLGQEVKCGAGPAALRGLAGG
jgi:hypothetical protein